MARFGSQDMGLGSGLWVLGLMAAGCEMKVWG